MEPIWFLYLIVFLMKKLVQGMITIVIVSFQDERNLSEILLNQLQLSMFSLSMNTRFPSRILYLSKRCLMYFLLTRVSKYFHVILPVQKRRNTQGSREELGGASDQGVYSGR